MPKMGEICYEPLNIKEPINFSKKSGLFTAQYAGQHYEHAQRDELTKMVLAVIEASTNITWIPVIEITLAAMEGRIAPTLRLEVERYFVGFVAGVGIKTSHWNCPDENRMKVSRDADWFVRRAATAASSMENDSDGREDNTAMTLHLPYYLPSSSGYGGDRYLLVYSEALWSQLEEIQNYLKLAHQKLSMHLATSDGIMTIQAMCRRMFDSVVAANNDDVISHE